MPRNTSQQVGLPLQNLPTLGGLERYSGAESAFFKRSSSNKIWRPKDRQKYGLVA